jgi:hypothetical protein
MITPVCGILHNLTRLITSLLDSIHIQIPHVNSCGACLATYPPDPLPLIREGGSVGKRGAKPLSKISSPKRRENIRESKRGEASKYIIGSSRETKSL